jgi:hypothetical protein
MFCTTIKLREVLNKQILSDSVPDAAVIRETVPLQTSDRGRRQYQS